MDFEIIRQADHTRVKVLSGKLDTNNAPDLKSELVVTTGNGERNIILDVSKCRYCDSSGLSAILVANRLCEDAGGMFILTGLQPDVEQIIRISMLHTVLCITRSPEEAETLMKERSGQ
ncbi:MAG: STAS domain-containing protein [Prolixibacteraceae bacterium]|jgi:anti-anti-sigma factor|nr:STAS domain-containing protein [Prolixibacteraceae bacterium]